MPNLGLFDTRTNRAIADSLRVLREAQWSARSKAYKEAMLAYVGGPERVDWLVQHEREHDKVFEKRRQRFFYPNYFGRLADALIDGVYGDPVERTLEKAGETQQELFAGIYRRGRIPRAQRQIGSSIVLFGEAWMSARWREKWETVGIYPVYPGSMWYTCDPDDPGLVTTTLEEKQVGIDEQGNPVCTYWYADEEVLWEVDQDGRTITQKFAHGYGMVPYVRWLASPVVGFDDALSPVRDQISMQKALINRASELETMLVYQAFSLLVLSGPGEPEKTVGPTAFLDVGVGGDAKYIQPNAPIEPFQRTVDALIEQMFETGSTPISMVKGGTANSGFQLVMEFLPHLRKVETLRTEAEMAEEELAKLICRIGSYHGLALPSDPKVTIKFAENVLPVDKEAEFVRDKQRLEGNPPTLTLEDFLKKWSPEKAKDHATLGAYMAELKGMQDEKAQREAAQFGGGPHAGGSFLGGAGAEA